MHATAVSLAESGVDLRRARTNSGRNSRRVPMGGSASRRQGRICEADRHQVGGARCSAAQN